jgi:SNF2 family DNA or RNA helicase
VENSVADLWSIMEFLNPGLLGSNQQFRKNYFYPIEVSRDAEATQKLLKITQPFILRRVKTDKSIIDDLPEKQEIKVFCSMTREQVTLYSAVTKDLEARLKSAEGIGRSGLVLATLAKLKQVCNHPAHFLADQTSLSGRSGKLIRLEEITEEILTAREKVLIFSQFKEMGSLIKQALEDKFGEEILFLHGAVSKKERDKMVDRFQSADGPSIFMLSLKAGGTGLNLTAANHVIHYDRWWNPAVENQASDRAFRIGQTKMVQVRKFICAGTLEEKIDNMIEGKAKVAAEVVGTGEGWLTNLSNDDLKQVLALSSEALADD